jgi:hypothetical protein
MICVPAADNRQTLQEKVIWSPGLCLLNFGVTKTAARQIFFDP